MVSGIPTEGAPAPRLLHLRSEADAPAPVSLVIVEEGDRAWIAHWGVRLGVNPDAAALVDRAAAASQIDDGFVPSLLSPREHGWPGRPALRLRRGATVLRRPLAYEGAVADARETAPGAPAAERLTLRHHSAEDAVLVVTEFELGGSGLLRVRHRIVNEGADALAVDDAAVLLPVPERARELIDTTGRWNRERAPQRHPLPQGQWLRAARHGRPGHDAPYLFSLGVPGFGHRRGEVWAAHLGWSGDAEHWAERTPQALTVLGAAERLEPEEVRLEPGEQHETPWLYAAYSAQGLDGVTAAFHGWLRGRGRHPRSPRPVVVNGWEAVGFEHSPAVLEKVAEDGARAGAELYMLDDGWFRGRRDDVAGLGDWTVDPVIWPQGLKPLADHVHGLGMRFGLWFEPEMVNEDSELAREHPEWLARPGGALPPRWRHQQSIDLTIPEAWERIRSEISARITEIGVDYVKWDQNRDPMLDGGHRQTRAVYRLMDALREEHPGLEIESCSAGGGRMDLGVLEHADRVWPSDTNDVLERARLQWWTQLLLPTELVGTQIGQAHAVHTTGRAQDLESRWLTAFFGHLGFEWGAERERDGSDRSADLAAFIALYKEHRALVHSGRHGHADLADPAYQLQGIVAEDGAEALFLFTALETSGTELPGMIALPGLESARRYRVALLAPARALGDHHQAAGLFMQRGMPRWLGEGVEATGEQLAELGLALPALNPEQSLLLRAVALA